MIGSSNPMRGLPIALYTVPSWGISKYRFRASTARLSVRWMLTESMRNASSPIPARSFSNTSDVASRSPILSNPGEASTNERKSSSTVEGTNMARVNGPMLPSFKSFKIGRRRSRYPLVTTVVRAKLVLLPVLLEVLPAYLAHDPSSCQACNDPPIAKRSRDSSFR